MRWAIALFGLGVLACEAPAPVRLEGGLLPNLDLPLTPQERLEELNARIKFEPKIAALYAQRAEVHHELNDGPNAIRDARKATQLADTSAPHWELLGFLAYAYREDSLAEVALKTALARGSAAPGTHHQLANVYALTQRYAAATAQIDKALALAPDSAMFWFTKGHIARLQGNTPAAETALTIALQKNPRHLKSLAERFALELDDRNDLAAARQTQAQLLAIAPAHPIVLRNAALLHFRTYAQAPTEKAELQFALNALNRALATDPNYAAAVYDRGYVYFELGRYKEALAEFERATQLNPTDYRAWFMRGSVHEYFEDVPQARRYYQKALALKPDFAAAQRALTELN